MPRGVHARLCHAFLVLSIMTTEPNSVNKLILRLACVTAPKSHKRSEKPMTLFVARLQSLSVYNSDNTLSRTAAEAEWKVDDNSADRLAMSKCRHPERRMTKSTAAQRYLLEKTHNFWVRGRQWHEITWRHSVDYSSHDRHATLKTTQCRWKWHSVVTGSMRYIDLSSLAQHRIRNWSFNVTFTCNVNPPAINATNGTKYASKHFQNLI